MIVPELKESTKLEMALSLEDFRKRCFNEIRVLKDDHFRKTVSMRAQKTRLENELLALKEAIVKKQEELNAWQVICPNPMFVSAFQVTVPRPIVCVSTSGEGLPQASGVYLVWPDTLGERCLYVGQSVCIANRARIGANGRRSDGNIHAGEYLSWLPADVSELDYMEAFYIGVLRPLRNQTRKHLRARPAK